MPIVEIVSFTASPAALADVSLGDASLKYTKNAEGALSVVRGFQVEDKTRGYTVITWESLDHHKKMTERDDYPAFVESLKPTLASPLQIQHVQFDGDATAAFTAPVTEITIAKPKEGKTRADIEAVIEEIKKNSHLVKGAHPPLAWGKVQQEPEAYVLAIGWDSVEAHLTAVKVAPIDSLVAKLAEVADYDLKHVTLNQ
ncbi:hypothetical protein M413DRAFT_444241 [Hebeloma cylindrosporum]|uniref:ABM domain-containing protein n=1 Tax=Hebeloma cylindrosporum TaxID=76867 RepID=A0A0C3C3C8_HEBCY|nr:hypothetical protein M413DRAFT_444241 [Hebeloma cylindrosporum h7]